MKTIKIAVLLISISVIISGCGKKEESIKNETVKKILLLRRQKNLIKT
ncbi:MAG: hypothetical protein IPP52_16070 [Ignavibacteria bacterium]|nr:hypothetical protein [Ignavibacteria bacterium]